MKFTFVVHTHNYGREGGTPDSFSIFVEQFFVNKYQDIILKFIETHSNRVKDATQLDSVLSYTAERETPSPLLCGFDKDDVKVLQLHSKIRQYLASDNLNSSLQAYFKAPCGKTNFCVFAVHVFRIALCEGNCPEEAHLNRWAKRRLIIK